MIELFALRNDRIERLEGLKGFGPSRGVSWVRCVEPVEADLESISELLRMPLQDLKESVEEDARSKLTVGRHIELIFSVPSMSEGEVLTVPLHIFAVGSLLVTVERKSIKVLGDLSKALIENKRRFLFRKHTAYFIYYVLDKVNDEFLYFVDKISLKLELFRERKALSKDAIQKIYDTSITLSYFNQSLIANIDVLNELRKSYFRMFSQEDRDNFSELYYDALQVLDTEKIQRELLSNLFSMHSTLIGNELNYFMRIVALVALLSTVPMLITSIFSMNIRNVPLVQGEHAFFVILGLIAVSSIASFILFRWFARKWQ